MKHKHLTPYIFNLLLSLLLSSLLFSAGEGRLKGQGAVSVAPDCGPFYLTFTAAGNSPSLQGYSNEQSVGGFGAGGCTSWTVMYNSVGFTGVTLALQSAPPLTATTPGVYVNFAGTVVTGINPNTSTVGAQSTFGNGAVNIAWIRLNLSGLMGAGTVTTVFYGYKTTPSGSGGVPPTAPYNPLVTCPTPQAITLAAMGQTQLVAPVMGKTITVCHFSVAFDSAVDFQWFTSTAAACAGAVALTGPYENIATIAEDVPFVLGSGLGLCANVSAATAGGGLLIFGQQ